MEIRQIMEGKTSAKHPYVVFITHRGVFRGGYHKLYNCCRVMNYCWNHIGILL